MINAYVNEKCNGCGGCLNSIYFEEKDNGDVQVKNGTIIPDSALDELNNLSADCPCQAIIIENRKKTAKEISQDLLKYVDQIQDIKHIDDADEIAMSELGHKIEFRYSIRSEDDGFRSYDSAESALRQEIHCIWDDRKEYALMEAQKYVHNELRKYWDINYPEGIYAETQENIRRAVRAISNGLYSTGVIKEELQEKDYRVEFTEWTTRWLLEPECISKEWAQAVHDKLDNGYMRIALHKAEIKSYEEIVDGFRGKTKYKTMWKYKHGENCEKEIRSQIISKLIFVSKYGARKVINEIIDEYNKQLAEIRNKLKLLIEGNRNGFIIADDNEGGKILAQITEDKQKKQEPVMIQLTQEMIERREYGIPSRKGYISKVDSLYPIREEENTKYDDYCSFSHSDMRTQKEKFLKNVAALPDNKYVVFLQDYFYRKYKNYDLPYFEMPLDDKKRLQLYNRTALESGHPEYIVDLDGKEIKEKFISVKNKSDVIYLTDAFKERRGYGQPVRKGINYDGFFTGIREYNTVRSDYCNFVTRPLEEQRELFKRNISDNVSSLGYKSFLRDYFYRKHMNYILPYFELPYNDSGRMKLYNETALESAHPEYMVGEHGEPLYEEWFYFDKGVTLGDIFGE